MTEDWNYLKKTLNDGAMFKQDDKENRLPSHEIIDFHEKVDTVLEKQEEFVGVHMEMIKDNA